MSSDTNEYMLNLDNERHNRDTKAVANTAIIASSSTIAGIGCSLTSGPLAPILGPICGVIGAIIGSLISSAINSEPKPTVKPPQDSEPKPTVKSPQDIDSGPLRYPKYVYEVEMSFPKGIIFRENIPLDVDDIFIYTLRRVGRVASSDKPSVTAFRIGGPNAAIKLIHQSGEPLTELGEPAVTMRLINSKGNPEYLQQANFGISCSSSVGHAPVCVVDWMVIKSHQYSGFINDYVSAINKNDAIREMEMEMVYIGPYKEVTSFRLGHLTQPQYVQPMISNIQSSTA